jgi:hypothetical protein
MMPFYITLKKFKSIDKNNVIIRYANVKKYISYFMPWALIVTAWEGLNSYRKLKHLACFFDHQADKISNLFSQL